ncbi:MAG: hypothetical protein AAGH45_10940 [Pseudomonadota bacterium]
MQRTSHFPSAALRLASLFGGLVMLLFTPGLGVSEAKAGVVLSCVADQSAVQAEVLVGGEWQTLDVDLPYRTEAAGSHQASVDIALKRACRSAIDEGLEALQTSLAGADRTDVCAAVISGVRAELGTVDHVKLVSARMGSSALRDGKSVPVAGDLQCAPAADQRALHTTLGRTPMFQAMAR